MPLYEYVCEECNDRFDRLVRSFAEADGVTCTSCESEKVRRLMSRVAVVGGLDDPITPLASTGGGGCCGGSCGCGH